MIQLLHNILLARDICQRNAGLKSKSKLLKMVLPEPQNDSVTLGNEYIALWALVSSFVKMSRVISKISEVPYSSKILRTKLSMPFPDSTYLWFGVIISRSNYHVPPLWGSICLESNLNWKLSVYGGCSGVPPHLPSEPIYINSSHGCQCCLLMAHSWVPPQELLSAE